MLKIQKFKDINIYSNQIKKLLRNAFPFYQHERPTTWFLFRAAKKYDYINFHLIIDDEKFVGLFYTIEQNEFMYIFLFAIDPSFRNNGLGGKALDLFTKKYENKTIYLCYEEPIEEDERNIRKRREDFYYRHNFFFTGVISKEYGVRYKIASYNNKKVTYEDHFNLYGKHFCIFNKFFMKKIN